MGPGDSLTFKLREGLFIHDTPAKNRERVLNIPTVHLVSWVGNTQNYWEVGIQLNPSQSEGHSGCVNSDDYTIGRWMLSRYLLQLSSHYRWKK